MGSSSKIPDELKKLPQWVVWRIEERFNGKEVEETKPPFDPNKIGFVYASSTNPETWGSFDLAVQHLVSYGADGVGFVVTKNDDFVGIDLDDCLDPKSGKIDEWAQNIIMTINSYSEISPSGEGVRIFAKGSLPENGRRTGQLEIYAGGRYLTVTGNHLSGTPLTIEKRQKEIGIVYRKYFPATNRKRKDDANSETSDDGYGVEAYQNSKITNPSETLAQSDKIIELALNAKNGAKFKRLWRGDTTGYASPSEADLAFCQMLAFWCGKDPDAMDKLFRNSKLYRPKWDSRRGNKTYGQATIEKAITTTQNTYKPRKKTTLFDIASDVELFHSTDNEAWVTFKVDDHYETVKLNDKGSKNFRIWISHEYYQTHSRFPKQKDVENLLKVFEMKALREGFEHRLHVRIGRHRNKIYLDLCNAEWEIVEISKKDWKIINTKDCPIKFRREAGMKALPCPQRGGDLNVLRKVLNLSDDRSFVLTIAWIIGALNPEGPYPVLLVTGEQGAAKSSFARFSRCLIDPSEAPLRSLPFKEHDLIISANNSGVLAYDNISYIKRYTADAICRIATGSGHAARKLYTDSGEVILSASRPVILNGIELHNHFHDLMARCISIDLPRISKKKRRTEKQLWKKFNKLHPKLLGALLDAVAAALKNYKRTKVKGSPRMADFAKWVVAAESSLPWKKGTFLKYYRLNLAETEQKSLEADAVALAIQSLMEDFDLWNGTASKLLEELEGDPKQGTGYVPASTVKSGSWPKSANQLSARIKRAAPLLKAQGIKFKRGRKSKRRHITLKRVKRVKNRNGGQQ